MYTSHAVLQGAQYYPSAKSVDFCQCRKSLQANIGRNSLFLVNVLQVHVPPYLRVHELFIYISY